MSTTKDGSYMVEVTYPNGHLAYFRAGTGMSRNQVERFLLKQGFDKTDTKNVLAKSIGPETGKVAKIHFMDDLSKLS